MRARYTGFIFDGRGFRFLNNSLFIGFRLGFLLWFVHVHGSLLPKYRGAAPVQWAVLNGDTETGITICMMVMPV
ncbi:MAG: hypothetical protein KKD59_02950, partial [Acidobacteria bacterium]|nr:hypothetical protein [Acidobacteriota bacterium]